MAFFNNTTDTDAQAKDGDSGLLNIVIEQAEGLWNWATGGDVEIDEDGEDDSQEEQAEDLVVDAFWNLFGGGSDRVVADGTEGDGHGGGGMMVADVQPQDGHNEWIEIPSY